MQTNLAKSLLVLRSPILVEILNFTWWWSRLPVPSQAKDTCKGGAVEIYQGIPTQCLDAEWGLVERYQGMPTQLKDTGGIWLRDIKGIPTQWKGMGGSQLKDTEEYPGLS